MRLKILFYQIYLSRDETFFIEKIKESENIQKLAEILFECVDDFFSSDS